MTGRDLLTLNLVERTAPRGEARDEAPTRWSQWEAYREASGLGGGGLFADPDARRRPGRFVWLGVSLLLQAAVAGIWVFRSMSAEVEPPPPRTVEAFLSAPSVVPAPPPPVVGTAPASTPGGHAASTIPSIHRATFEPAEIPIGASELTVGTLDDDRSAGGVPGGVVGGLVGGLGEPPPRTKPTPSTPRTFRVGGPVRPPRKIVHVDPVYPDLASYARVEGLVVLEATIDGDGNVENVRILRSIPLLDEAAVDAVRQWKYEPTIVDGKPVPILMTVTVTFALA